MFRLISELIQIILKLVEVAKANAFNAKTDGLTGEHQGIPSLFLPFLLCVFVGIEIWIPNEKYEVIRSGWSNEKKQYQPEGTVVINGYRNRDLGGIPHDSLKLTIQDEKLVKETYGILAL